MGVSRQLFISHRWNVEDIKDTLESIFSIKVEYQTTHSANYSILHFMVSGEKRSMDVFSNVEKGGFTGLSLKLGASGQSDRILRELAERLGGFYNEQDCDSNFVEYEYKHSSNLEYYLKEAAKKGITDSVSFQKYLKQQEKELKVWQEENHRRFSEMLTQMSNKRGGKII